MKGLVLLFHLTFSSKTVPVYQQDEDKSLGGFLKYEIGKGLLAYHTPSLQLQANTHIIPFTNRSLSPLLTKPGFVPCQISIFAIPIRKLFHYINLLTVTHCLLISS